MSDRSDEIEERMEEIGEEMSLTDDESYHDSLCDEMDSLKDEWIEAYEAEEKEKFLAEECPPENWPDDDY